MIFNKLSLSFCIILSLMASPVLAQYEEAPHVYFPNDDELLLKFEKIDYSLTLRDLGGKEVRLEDFRGKIIFLNFTSVSTSCAPCLEDLGHVGLFKDSLQGKGYERRIVIIIAFKESLPQLKKSVPVKPVASHAYNYGTIPPSFGQIKSPTTFIIDQAGTIVFRQEGMANWNDSATLYFISEKLLKFSRPTPSVELPEIPE